MRLTFLLSGSGFRAHLKEKIIRSKNLARLFLTQLLEPSELNHRPHSAQVLGVS
jgi:hypothetical protein